MEADNKTTAVQSKGGGYAQFLACAPRYLFEPLKQGVVAIWMTLMLSKPLSIHLQLAYFILGPAVLLGRSPDIHLFTSAVPFETSGIRSAK